MTQHAITPDDREPLVTVNLLPEKSERGTLLLDSDIVADVWVDGQNSGFVSPTMFRLPAGEHTVQLRDSDEPKSPLARVRIKVRPRHPAVAQGHAWLARGAPRCSRFWLRRRARAPASPSRCASARSRPKGPAGRVSSTPSAAMSRPKPKAPCASSCTSTPSPATSSRWARACSKGQLDGVASGQFLCQTAAPSMRVLRMPGVFQSRDEARDVVARLQPTVEDEAAHNGFVILGAAGLGPDVFFTREPVRSLEDVAPPQAVALGHRRGRHRRLAADGPRRSCRCASSEARRAYDDKRIDGFIAAPSAALAFQWSSVASYVTDLHSGYIYGCLVFGERQFQRLAPELQAAMRAGAARMLVGIDELGRRQDEALLGGLFSKQGLKSVPVSPAFRAEYFAAARSTRAQLVDRLIPRALLERVLRMLADYRIEHPQR